LFTSILNSRLSNFSDETDLVTKSQAGFRAGYSTQDNIFILYSLITLYKKKKKNFKHFSMNFSMLINFCHNPALQVVSNALLKSIKQQNNFFFFDKYKLIKL
jgi:hypothetical protein